MVEPPRGRRRAWKTLGVAFTLLMVAALATPAFADHERGRRGREIEVVGVILSLNVGHRAFLLREERRGADRFWVVRVRGNVEVEVDRRGHRDDDDLHGRAALRFLRVGDRVEVEGRLLGSQEILAREIEVLGRARVVLRPVIIGRPVREALPTVVVPVAVVTAAPRILQPRNGAMVGTDIVIVGRTFPGAAVHVEVGTELLGLQFFVASGDVRADSTGLFVATVRPPLRMSGALYRIVVTARVNGVVSPPASVVVRQF